MWDSKSYWLKSKLYIKKAMENRQNQWEYPFWCSLSLEHLARALITKLHPVLNADPQNEGLHIMYALGFHLIEQPKTIPIHSVLARLQKLVPEFQKPHKDFCDYFLVLRNQEVHSGKLAFESLNLAKWQPRFFEVCRLFSELLGHKLDELLGTDLAGAAIKIINAMKSKKVSMVKKEISIFKKKFNSKTKNEKLDLKKRSESLFLSSGSFTKIECPACGCWGRLDGDFVKAAEPRYEDDLLIAEHIFLARIFACVSCGLKLNDIEEIHIAGLNSTFSSDVATNLHELFESEYYEDYMNM